MSYHTTGITVEIVGTESSTQGRSCDEDSICGSVLEESFVVRNIGPCWRPCGPTLDAFLNHPEFPFLSNPILEGLVHRDVDRLTQSGAPPGMCSTSTPNFWISRTTEAIIHALS
jgi:hypothetical protein